MWELIASNTPSRAVSVFSNWRTRPSELHWGSKLISKFAVDAQSLVVETVGEPARAGQGKGREAVDALALGHVTTSGPDFVGHPWKWGSLCSTLYLAKLAGSMKSVLTFPFPSVPLLLQLSCCCFRLYTLEENHRCFLQSQSEPTHFRALFTHTRLLASKGSLSVCLLSSQAR